MFSRVYKKSHIHILKQKFHWPASINLQMKRTKQWKSKYPWLAKRLWSYPCNLTFLDYFANRYYSYDRYQLFDTTTKHFVLKWCNYKRIMQKLFLLPARRIYGFSVPMKNLPLMRWASSLAWSWCGLGFRSRSTVSLSSQVWRPLRMGRHKLKYNA